MSTSELYSWIVGDEVENFLKEHSPEESAVLMHELADDNRYLIEIVNIALSKRAKIPLPLSRQECEDYLNRFKTTFFWYGTEFGYAEIFISYAEQNPESDLLPYMGKLLRERKVHIDCTNRVVPPGLARFWDS